MNSPPPEFYAAITLSFLSLMFASAFIYRLLKEKTFYETFLNFASLNTVLKFKLILYVLFILEQPILIYFYFARVFQPENYIQTAVLNILFLSLLWSKFALMIFASIYRFSRLMKVNLDSLLLYFTNFLRFFAIAAYVTMLAIILFETIHVNNINTKEQLAIVYVIIGGMFGIFDNILNIIMTYHVLSSKFAESINNNAAKRKVMRNIRIKVVCFYIVGTIVAITAALFFFLEHAKNQIIELISLNVISMGTLMTMKVLDLIKLAMSTVKSHVALPGNDHRKITQLSSVAPPSHSSVGAVEADILSAEWN